MTDPFDRNTHFPSCHQQQQEPQQDSLSPSDEDTPSSSVIQFGECLLEANFSKTDAHSTKSKSQLSWNLPETSEPFEKIRAQDVEAMASINYYRRGSGANDSWGSRGSVVIYQPVANGLTYEPVATVRPNLVIRAHKGSPRSNQCDLSFIGFKAGLYLCAILGDKFLLNL